jgi:hypothetical protein
MVNHAAKGAPNLIVAGPAILAELGLNAAIQDTPYRQNFAHHTQRPLAYNAPDPISGNVIRRSALARVMGVISTRARD